MPTYIVEVLNDTDGLLHYHNQESGLKFDVSPTRSTVKGHYADAGYVTSSKYQLDTVPYKSSSRSIIIDVENGPKFSICDDYYHFSVVGNGHSPRLTGPIDSGDKFVIKVNNNEISFIKYDEGLRANDLGYVPINSIPAAAKSLAIVLQALGK